MIDPVLGGIMLFGLYLFATAISGGRRQWHGGDPMGDD
ncbi:MAG: hypothetical protein Dasosvirus4_9 [Dasosvirus sp.]|uniref:Uncharacterized protein n=1 Tax=Dasosvirus sp. TaxID=2487764 RepID=A0A3G4ZRF6_9VIRU|nr:MAG: hypothetical protein Dasosvirus4_9 [Dasosvirus sp.]